MSDGQDDTGTAPAQPVLVHEGTRAFRGARFRQVDLSGAVLRECDVTGMRIVGFALRDLRALLPG